MLSLAKFQLTQRTPIVRRRFSANPNLIQLSTSNSKEASVKFMSLYILLLLLVVYFFVFLFFFFFSDQMFGKLCALLLLNFVCLFFVRSIPLELLFGVVAIISHCDCDQVLLVFLVSPPLHFFTLLLRCFFSFCMCLRRIAISPLAILCLEKTHQQYLFWRNITQR